MASAADIPELVRRLRSPRRLEQAQAADALARLVQADPQASVEALMAAGGHTALARLLVNPSSQAAQAAAARALNASVLSIAHSGTTGGLAAQFLADLAAAVAGSIPALVSLLVNPEEQVQLAVASLLATMACPSQSLGLAVVAAGAVPALLECVRQASTGVVQSSHMMCAQALEQLCLGSPDVQRAVAAAGAAEALLPLLVSSNSWAQCTAADALDRLARGCQEGKQAAVAAGAVPALAHLLTSSREEAVQAKAAGALFELKDCCNEPEYVQHLAPCIPALVRLLRSSQDKIEQHTALMLLSSLLSHGIEQHVLASVEAGVVAALEHYLSAATDEEAEFVNAARFMHGQLQKLQLR